MIPLSYFMNGEYISIDTINHIADLEQEIERLNNIINKIEETIEERKRKTNRDVMTERTKIRINYNLDYILDKIKELKGSDKDVSFYSRI